MAGSGPLPTGTSSPTLELPGTSAAIASDWVSGVSTLGNVAWDFALDIPADFAPGAMPPTPQNPWRLRLTDGGYLNRGGRIQSFRMVWHASSADFVYEGGPLPVQTLEGGTVETQVPAPLTGVTTVRTTSALRAGPNPVRSGRAVTWLGSAVLDADLAVFDIGGRQVATIPAGSLGSDRRWEARDRLGRPLPAGLYLARAGRETARLVVLSP
jgi:hypothetical protein